MRDDEPDDIGAAFQKFAVVTKELANLMKNMVRTKKAFSMYKTCPNGFQLSVLLPRSSSSFLLLDLLLFLFERRPW